MDRRLTPFSGRIAHVSLRGQIEAEAFTEGEPASILLPLVDLLKSPEGPRDRQVLLGDAVTVLDQRDGHAFVTVEKDGYCGWVDLAAIGPAIQPTHRVCAVASHLYAGPKVQAADRAALPMNARLVVSGVEGAFAFVGNGYVPAVHLCPAGEFEADPVQVAERFLHVPYLWGGDSHAGLDCSGLVKAALHACGLPCPGDSDLQQGLGQPLADETPLRRGDLLFWKGHVAMIVDGQRLIHANGHSMSVAYEGIGACISRIVDQGGGPVTARRRILA